MQLDFSVSFLPRSFINLALTGNKIYNTLLGDKNPSRTSGSSSFQQHRPLYLRRHCDLISTRFDRCDRYRVDIYDPERVVLVCYGIVSAGLLQRDGLEAGELETVGGEKEDRGRGLKP